MSNKHHGRHTAEWLAAWNALDALEAFWRTQAHGAQDAVVDGVRELRTHMTGLVQPPGLRTATARTAQQVHQRAGMVSPNAAQRSAAMVSGDGSSKVPPSLQPAYATIQLGLQQLHTVLRAQYSHSTQAKSFGHYLTCLQDTLIDLAATLGDSPTPRTFNGAGGNARSDRWQEDS
jgi:hypothetical protein